MKRQQIIYAVIVLVGVTAFIVFFNYDMKKADQLYNQLIDQYSPIDLTNELEGVVTFIYSVDTGQYREDPYVTYFVVNDSLSKRIKVTYELTLDIPLKKILRVGDKVLKRKGSDDFFVLKIKDNDTLKYTFQLKK